MEGADLSFSRRGIAAWDGIWLLPSGPRYDILGGGITIIESRSPRRGRRESDRRSATAQMVRRRLARAARRRKLSQRQRAGGAMSDPGRVENRWK